MEALFNYRMGSRIKAFLIDFKLVLLPYWKIGYKLV